MQTTSQPFVLGRPAITHRNAASLRAPAMPSIITIELTTRCNNRCSGCANIELVRRRQQQTDHLGVMTGWRAMLLRLAEETTPASCILRFSGGEPTLHPEFEQIVRLADELGFPHALLSTGKWASGRTKTLLDLYQNCRNAVGFLISLHGADAAAHHAFTESGLSSFGITCNNIRHITAAGIRVFTNTVITRANWNQIGDITRLSASLGAACAVFNRFIAIEHPLLPSEAQLKNAAQQVLALKRDGIPCRLGNSMPKCFLKMSSYPSVAGFEMACISVDGKVRPDNLTQQSFGDFPKKSLSDIWQSEQAWRYREGFPDSCLQCAALPACRGGVKSLFSGTPMHVFDPLIVGPLTLEDIIDIDEDKDKNMLDVLALTSD